MILWCCSDDEKAAELSQVLIKNVMNLTKVAKKEAKIAELKDAFNLKTWMNLFFFRLNY